MEIFSLISLNILLSVIHLLKYLTNPNLSTFTLVSYREFMWNPELIMNTDKRYLPWTLIRYIPRYSLHDQDIGPFNVALMLLLGVEYTYSYFLYRQLFDMDQWVKGEEARKGVKVREWEAGKGVKVRKGEARKISWYQHTIRLKYLFFHIYRIKLLIFIYVFLCESILFGSTYFFAIFKIKIFIFKMNGLFPSPPPP